MKLSQLLESPRWRKNGDEKGPIEMVPISSLKTNPNEPWNDSYARGDGKEYADKIAKAMLAGKTFPALSVTPENVIIDGRHRYEGAKVAGLGKVGIQRTSGSKLLCTSHK